MSERSELGGVSNVEAMLIAVRENLEDDVSFFIYCDALRDQGLEGNLNRLMEVFEEKKLQDLKLPEETKRLWITHWIDDPEAFKELMDKLKFPFTADQSPNQKLLYDSMFQSVKLGSFKTAEEIKVALDSSGIKIEEGTMKSIERSDFTDSMSQQEAIVELVILGPENLNFDHNPTLPEIETQAPILGLECCSSEVGPALSLKSKPPEGGFAFIILTNYPVTSSDWFDRLIIRNQQSEVNLATQHIHPNYQFNLPYDRLVFVRPRKN